MTELAQKDKGLVERIVSKTKSWIKGLRKAFAGAEAQSRESQITQTLDKLEEIRSMWEDALADAGRNYRASGKGAVNEGGERYQSAVASPEYVEYDKPITMRDVEILRTIADRGRISVNGLTHDDLVKSQKWAYKFYQELGTKSPFFRAWFGDWRANSTDQVSVVVIPPYVDSNEARKVNRGTYENSDTGWSIAVSREGERNTISHSGKRRLSEYGLSGIKGLIENGVLFDSEIHEHHSNNVKNDLIAFDHKLYALGRSEKGPALYRITVEERWQDPYHTNERRFHNLKYIEKVADVPTDANAKQVHKDGSMAGSPTTGYTISDLYSLVKRFDKDFHAGKTVNTTLLNKDGTPKAFYHGTDADFTAFDQSKSGVGMFGDGFYFTDSKEDAAGYGENVMPVYLRITNPYTATQKEAGYLNTAKIQKDGYDGIIIKGIDGTNMVVFDPTQIKSATDNIGTFDRDKPGYSLSNRRHPRR